MIEIIPTLLTPAMLAFAPPNESAPVHNYDWQTQRTVVSAADGSSDAVPAGTLNGTRSYVGTTQMIDDWNSD